MAELEQVGKVARRTKGVVKDVLIVMDTVLDAIATADSDGVASSTVYIALQSVGVNFNAYRGIVDGLQSAGLIRVKHFRLYITAEGLNWLAIRDQQKAASEPQQQPLPLQPQQA